MRTGTMRAAAASVLVLVAVATAQDWSYDNVDDWPTLFSSCAGDRQSPTPFSPVSTFSRCLSPMIRVVQGLGSLTKTEVTIYNKDGKTLEVKLSARIQFQILRDAFPNLDYRFGPAIYELDSFHFHWGTPDGGLGSEHALHGQRTDAEVHFVMYRRSYGSVTNALSRPDGLMVLGLMLTNLNNAPLTFPEDTLGLSSKTGCVRRPGDKLSYMANVKPLIKLMDDATADFIVYAGGLTTPPCTEVVTFLISQKPVSVTNDFLHMLTTTFYKDDSSADILVNNFRPEQPRSGRVVHRYF